MDSKYVKIEELACSALVDLYRKGTALKPLQVFKSCDMNNGSIAVVSDYGMDVLAAG